MKLEKDISFGEPLDETFFNDGTFLKIEKCNEIELQRVIPTNDQIALLYDLLKNRKFNISHSSMPTMNQHDSFVRSHPYRGWWLIYDASNNSDTIGSVYVGFDNSVGLNIDLNKITFSAKYFTQTLLKEINPLPPEPSKIFGDFFFNISPKNNDLQTWLEESKYNVTQISLSYK